MKLDHTMIFTRNFCVCVRAKTTRCANGTYSICVVLYSGEVYKYDSLTKSYRHYSNYEDSVAPPKDEREWRTRFSFNLCRMMMKRGWSQKDLAYATGITQSTMCKYMSGEVTPTLYKIMIITEALGCTIDDLAYS